jgi:hypothetical protein
MHLLHICHISHIQQGVSDPAPDLQYYLIYDQQEVSDTNWFADRGLNICQSVRMHLVFHGNLITTAYTENRR